MLRLLSDVRAGIRLHTIRWRESKILPGPMIYVSDRDTSDSVMVWVTHVEKMRLSDVSARLSKCSEWLDTELLEDMCELYPRIEMDSRGVVIHHSPPLE